MIEPTREELVTSLASNCCPACAEWKPCKYPVCWKCLQALPGSIKEALMRRFSYGYEQGVKDALHLLGAAQFHTERKPR